MKDMLDIVEEFMELVCNGKEALDRHVTYRAPP